MKQPYSCTVRGASERLRCCAEYTYPTCARLHLSGQTLIATVEHLQIKYEIVSEEELEKQRKQFRNGELSIKIEEEEFNMR